MNQRQDLTAAQVGDILTIPARDAWAMKNQPVVSATLYQIVKLTATQAVLAKYKQETSGLSEIRIRRADGGVIGKSYTYATLATPEQIAKHEHEIAMVLRYGAARRRVDDLLDRPLHQLGLNTEQLEALASAWETIKAMAPANEEGRAA